MSTNDCKCCSGCGSLDKFKRVCQIIESHDNDPAKLIPILQNVQREYRYLPEEILAYVATSLGLPPAKVYGVASFYALFSLKPKGKYVVHICDGTACHVKGSTAIIDALRSKLNVTAKEPTTGDQLFTVETVSCIGACGLAPAITINEEVHGLMTPEMTIKLVDDIIAAENIDE